MVARLLGAGARRLKPIIGWPAFILTVVAIWMAALGVLDAEWADQDLLFVGAATLSLLISVALAHTRIKGHWAALILALIGLLYISNSLTHFLPPLKGALAELGQGIAWLWLRLWRRDPSLPTFPLWNESGYRLALFADRLTSWAVGLTSGRTEQNEVAFLLITGLIMWGSTAWAIWGILRLGRTLLAMLPLGLALSMSTYMSGVPVGYLVSFGACVIMLLPVVHLTRQEQRWEREGIDYSSEIRFDLWQVTFAVVAILLILSLITPSFSVPRLLNALWKVISEPQQVLEELLIRFFGGVEPEPPPAIPVRANPGGSNRNITANLPRAHLLGGDNPGLSNQIVMYVCTDAPPPIPEDIFPEEYMQVGPRYYWKGLTYDTYWGEQWVNGQSNTTAIPAYEPVIQTTVTPTLTLKQRYLIQVPHGTALYAANEAYQVDRQVNSRRRTDSDLVGLNGTANDYVVDSLVPQATVRQLLSFSETYPSFIVNRYLQLPRRLPDRVQTLAREIVQDADSSYEKALAIQDYLRQFPYDLEVPVPPPGRDVVDFFLFDVQRGYCDYYGSAFVVLARAAGIPARLAIGYAMGGYSMDRGCYVVVERDAHSWPEVYFGDYGWISFEPTAAFVPLERPDDPIEPLTLESSPARPVPTRPIDVVVRKWWQEVRQDWTTYAVIAGGVALLVLLIVQAEIARRRSKLGAVEGIALCYEEMSHIGEQLGVARQPHDTPAEYADILYAALRTRKARWPWSDQKLEPVLEETGRGVRTLSQMYELASYGQLSMPEAQRGMVERQWDRLQRQMKRLRIVSGSVEI
jgi:transglutaminase-like putative cysteine protease